MFRVTTLPEGEKDFSADFFGKKTHLTVSGQLEAELASLGLGKVTPSVQLLELKILIHLDILLNFG